MVSTSIIGSLPIPVWILVCAVILRIVHGQSVRLPPPMQLSEHRTIVVIVGVDMMLMMRRAQDFISSAENPDAVYACLVDTSGNPDTLSEDDTVGAQLQGRTITIRQRAHRSPLVDGWRGAIEFLEPSDNTTVVFSYACIPLAGWDVHVRMSSSERPVCITAPCTEEGAMVAKFPFVSLDVDTNACRVKTRQIMGDVKFDEWLPSTVILFNFFALNRPALHLLKEGWSSLFKGQLAFTVDMCTRGCRVYACTRPTCQKSSRMGVKTELGQIAKLTMRDLNRLGCDVARGIVRNVDSEKIAKFGSVDEYNLAVIHSD